MGAHLGVGGSVVVEDILCTFHSWTFIGQGDCTSVPGLPGYTNDQYKLVSVDTIKVRPKPVGEYSHQQLAKLAGILTFCNELTRRPFDPLYVFTCISYY